MLAQINIRCEDVRAAPRPGRNLGGPSPRPAKRPVNNLNLPIEPRSAVFRLSAPVVQRSAEWPPLRGSGTIFGIPIREPAHRRTGSCQQETDSSTLARSVVNELGRVPVFLQKKNPAPSAQRRGARNPLSPPPQAPQLTPKYRPVRIACVTTPPGRVQPSSGPCRPCQRKKKPKPNWRLETSNYLSRPAGPALGSNYNVIIKIPRQQKGRTNPFRPPLCFRPPGLASSTPSPDSSVSTSLGWHPRAGNRLRPDPLPPGLGPVAAPAGRWFGRGYFQGPTPTRLWSDLELPFREHTTQAEFYQEPGPPPPPGTKETFA